jgi:nicotinamide mononucleotide adenylyltransferase
MTAVEWLIKQTESLITIETFQKWQSLKEQAKAMEKEQMVRAFHAACKQDYALEEIREWAQNYISSTYNKSKTPPGAHCEEA